MGAALMVASALSMVATARAYPAARVMNLVGAPTGAPIVSGIFSHNILRLPMASALKIEAYPIKPLL